MTTKLQKYFPMIQTREEVLAKIHSDKNLMWEFQSWEEEKREEFLNFCTGVKGVKMLYDSFFKEVFHPEYAPERLNELLSFLIGMNVKIVTVLPNDSVRIADESSLLIMDIVVELMDGSIANVEIQKIGYMFPGERSACYSADLLLRQYKRIRGVKGKRLSYKDIKTVYTIVFFEKSPREFQEYTKKYIHKFEQCSDTGIKLELLQKYIFISLDIFKENQHNKDIDNKLNAWLIFLCMDEPEMIVKLIEVFPEFQVLYKEIYNLCCNIERVMEMFSKELMELDRNTAQYMIDVMQDTIDEKDRTIAEKDKEIERLIKLLDEKR